MLGSGTVMEKRDHNSGTGQTLVSNVYCVSFKMEKKTSTFSTIINLREKSMGHHLLVTEGLPTLNDANQI